MWKWYCQVFLVKSFYRDHQKYQRPTKNYKIIKFHKKLFFETNISPARLRQFKLDKKIFKQLLHIQSWKRFTLKRVVHKYCLQIPVKFSSKCEKDLNYVWVNFSTCWIEKNYFTSKSFKRCSYRRAPMLKCNFNKLVKKLYWNKTSVVVFFCKFATYFQNTFFIRTLLFVSENLYH